jgi:hypothetical protein
MHRIRKVDLEFRLKFDVAITSDEILKLNSDKQKLL